MKGLDLKGLSRAASQLAIIRTREQQILRSFPMLAARDEATAPQIRRRSRMSASQRAAHSKRMKEIWRVRKAGAAKKK